MVKRLPTALVACLATVVVLSIYLRVWHGAHHGNKPTVQSTIQVLRSENLTFLVKRKVVTQVVIIKKTEPSWKDWVPYLKDYRAATAEDGYIVATASFYFGFDLSKLKEADVEAKDAAHVVHLPEPQELDLTIDYNNIEFVAISTGVVTRIALAMGADGLKDKLTKAIADKAREVVSSKKLLPSKSDLLQDMRGLERLLGQTQGVSVKFD
jgi:hypothetical protein